MLHIAYIFGASAFQIFGHRLDDSERRAELMGDIGEEIVTHNVELTKSFIAPSTQTKHKKKPCHKSHTQCQHTDCEYQSHAFLSPLTGKIQLRL